MKRTNELLQAVQTQNQYDLRALRVAYTQNLEVMQKHQNRALIAANDFAASRGDTQ